MVFGGIGYNCRLDLRRLVGGVTGEKYARLLSYQVLPEIIRKKGQNFIFIQDNAPPHRAARTQAALRRRNVEQLEFWPPNSYDLNPIENIWGILKTRIRTRNPQNLNELWAFALEEWEAIPQATINECIDSMPERILAVLRARGGRTRY
jgi:transposase